MGKLNAAYETEPPSHGMLSLRRGHPWRHPWLHLLELDALILNDLAPNTMAVIEKDNRLGMTRMIFPFRSKAKMILNSGEIIQKHTKAMMKILQNLEKLKKIRPRLDA